MENRKLTQKQEYKPEYLLTLFLLLTSFGAFGKDTSETKSSKLSESLEKKEIVKEVIREAPEFEFVSDTAEIAGDPHPGLKESYASWKEACENWKKEMKEMNKQNEILSLNCNAPSSSRQHDGLQIYRSNGSYKLKVRVKTP